MTGTAVLGASNAGIQGAAYVFNGAPGLPPDVFLQFPDGSMGVWNLTVTGRQLSIASFAFLATPSPYKLVDVADINNDGIPDLILQFTDGSIGVWFHGWHERNENHWIRVYLRSYSRLESGWHGRSEWRWRS